MVKALILYHSNTGNTEKAAQAIRMGIVDAGASVTVLKAIEAGDVDFLNYDLVCVGSPSMEWHPAQPICDLLTKKMTTQRREGRIKLCAPKIPGKKALIFITYSGPHTGLNEAVPAGKHLGQFFEHMGFEVVDEWYVLSQFNVSFPGNENVNTEGLMGDIRGKPTTEDLEKIRRDARALASRIG